MRIVQTVVAVILLAVMAIPVHAQSTRPVTIVVALAAGTGMDAIVRLYGEKLSKRIRQPVVIENKPGAAGLVAVEAVLNAPADGHTLGAATSSIMAIRPSLFKSPPYDPRKDFVPISLYLKSPFILVVDPQLPVRSVPELIAYIKSNPGKVSFSSSSVGGAPHLCGEYMKQRFSLDMNHVPYKNSPQSIADVAAGHVSMAFAEAGASLPLINAGKLRAIAVTSQSRLPALPNVPSFAEAAGVPDFEAVSWHVLFAKSSMPSALVDKLHDDIDAIIAEPDIQQAILHHGLLPQKHNPLRQPRPISPPRLRNGDRSSDRLALVVHFEASGGKLNKMTRMALDCSIRR